MKPETHDHLSIAEGNRALARELVNSVNNSQASLPSAAREWAVVVAFYAAVHYVNAFLWEARRYAPDNHRQRTRRVRTDTELIPIASAYDFLRDRAYYARYQPLFRLPDADLPRVLDFMDQIAIRIHLALNLTPPP